MKLSAHTMKNETVIAEFPERQRRFNAMGVSIREAVASCVHFTKNTVSPLEFMKTPSPAAKMRPSPLRKHGRITILLLGVFALELFIVLRRK